MFDAVSNHKCFFFFWFFCRLAVELTRFVSKYRLLVFFLILFLSFVCAASILALVDTSEHHNVHVHIKCDLFVVIDRMISSKCETSLRAANYFLVVTKLIRARDKFIFCFGAIFCVAFSFCVFFLCVFVFILVLVESELICQKLQEADKPVESLCGKICSFSLLLMLQATLTWCVSNFLVRIFFFFLVFNGLSSHTICRPMFYECRPQALLNVISFQCFFFHLLFFYFAVSSVALRRQIFTIVGVTFCAFFLFPTTEKIVRRIEAIRWTATIAVDMLRTINNA